MENRPPSLRMKDIMVQSEDSTNESRTSSLHRVSCLWKKYERNKNHMNEVICLVTRLHTQIQSLRSLFLGVVHNVDQMEQDYYDRETYAEITHRLKHATTARERASLRVEARRERIRARRACMKPLSTSHPRLDEIRNHNPYGAHTPNAAISPSAKLFRCGNEDCLLEYDETTPSKLPSTPKRGSQIGDFGDGIFGSEFRTPTQNSLFGSHGSGSPMSRMGLEQVHEDTSVWATLVNELTKEWKNSGTPVAMLRYAKVHSCMKPGNKRHKHSETQQVTLSDLSKITCDTTALNTRYSESDIAGPLHSTMNDLDFSPIKEEKINHQVSHGSDHSLNTASSCSSLDPKEFKSGAWLTEESNIYQEIHPVSVDFPSYPENQVPHTSNNHYYSSLPSSRFELSGNSYQVKHGSKMESNGMPSQQFSVEATCNSVPDWDNLTVPTTDGSQQTQESIPSDRMSSLISSSYKESDAISDSSINESDLEALQPKFKKPVGRAKRAHRTRSDIVDSSGHSSDSKFALHAPMNSPNASGSTKRTISSDIIINNVKSNEKLPELAESSSINTTDNSSMLNHTRPDCIGKLMTPAYQPVVFRNTQYMNSDNDSGIGVRPPCVGCSETPLNINLQGRYITYESDEEDSGSDNENFDEDDIHHISGLGMRPDCLGKSMMEIKQLVTPQTTHVRRSIDTDSGVSQLGSPGKILPPEIPVQRNPRSRYARLRVGCMSSESDQSMYGDQIEVLESHIVQKGNKKSIVRRLRNFGHFFGRNRKSSVK